MCTDLTLDRDAERPARPCPALPGSARPGHPALFGPVCFLTLNHQSPRDTAKYLVYFIVQGVRGVPVLRSSMRKSDLCTALARTVPYF